MVSRLALRALAPRLLAQVGLWFHVARVTWHQGLTHPRSSIGGCAAALVKIFIPHALVMRGRKVLGKVVG